MSRRVCIIRHRDYELPLRREAEALHKAGYDVDVICLADGSSFVEELNGVRCYRLPLRRERGGVLRYVADYGAFFVASALLLTALHLRRRYDAIQVNTMPDFLAFVTVIPRLLGAKAIVFMKEPSPELADMMFGDPRVTRLYTLIERWVLRYAHHAFTVTEQLKERFVSRGADGSKIDVILNGPDPEYLLAGASTANARAGDFTLVCHGTIEERYGHGTMLEAVRLARMEVPGLKLLITGSGSGVSDLLTGIERSDLTGSVSYLGHVPIERLREILQGADVGMVPMSSNGYSNLVHTNKMFEYMLLSKPVIATRLASVSAYFDDDSVAFVEPDDPKSMAQAIIDLYGDPNRRIALAHRASELYRTYGWDQQAAKYVATYDRLLGADPGGAR